jgi:hypothetical protein
MQDIVIPGWALLVFGVVVLPWAIWITSKTWNNEKDSALRGAAMTALGDDLKEIYDELKRGDQKIDDRFKEMNSKLDLFIHQEITFLKQVVIK